VHPTLQPAVVLAKITRITIRIVFLLCDNSMSIYQRDFVASEKTSRLHKTLSLSIRSFTGNPDDYLKTSLSPNDVFGPHTALQAPAAGLNLTNVNAE
jgi:hypothetical protein